MAEFTPVDIPVSKRIGILINDLFKNMPEIEVDRAVLLTESYMQTEGQPIVRRRALAFKHILENIPITIRREELVVGSSTKAPRSCQVFPEYSYEWLESELDTVETRSADPFYISEENKDVLRKIYPYWKGKTTSELATAYMAPETIKAIEHNIFTPGNYFYNGIGHFTVDYGKILKIGYKGLIQEAKDELSRCNVYDPDYSKKSEFLNAVIISCEAVITYAKRYAALALDEAEKCQDKIRRQELLAIAQNCANVPENPAENFMEA